MFFPSAVISRSATLLHPEFFVFNPPLIRLLMFAPVILLFLSSPFPQDGGEEKKEEGKRKPPFFFLEGLSPYLSLLVHYPAFCVLFPPHGCSLVCPKLVVGCNHPLIFPRVEKPSFLLGGKLFFHPCPLFSPYNTPLHVFTYILSVPPHGLLDPLQYIPPRDENFYTRCHKFKEIPLCISKRLPLFFSQVTHKMCTASFNRLD